MDTRLRESLPGLGLLAVPWELVADAHKLTTELTVHIPEGYNRSAGLAIAQSASPDFQQVLAHMRAGVWLSPLDTGALHDLALTYLRLARFDAADVLFRRVKAAQPASANVDHLLDVLAQNFKSNEWQPLADKLPRVLSPAASKHSE